MAKGSNGMANSEAIRFVLNGKVVCVEGVPPTRTVLNYLRETASLIGTKEGCAEGDCGACTVVVGELCGGKLRMQAVNSCIQFLPTVDGKAVFTVESLRQEDGTLHPVQQAMVACHGSQCGFCTPGFVMSMWAVYLEHCQAGTVPDDAQLRTALSGNLCRCTGYRPILEAGTHMFALDRVAFDGAGLARELATLARDQALHLEVGGQQFYAPHTLDALVRLRSQYPGATILSGSTDIGLWVNKHFRDLGDIIYVGRVAEFLALNEANGEIYIGAGVSLSDAYALLTRHYPEIDEMCERFASVPIRNAGTLGGNVANGSPIGDSMPWLIAVGARVVLASVRGLRELPMEDLYLGYLKKAMEPDEVVAGVKVPLRSPLLRFRTYKVSKRYDSDISAVCAAFAIELSGTRIASARMVFGGMAAIPARAWHAEAVLAGRAWDEAALAAARVALAADYRPLTDMRASAEYRMRVAENLVTRFFLETRPNRALPAHQVSVFAAQ